MLYFYFDDHTVNILMKLKAKFGHIYATIIKRTIVLRHEQMIANHTTYLASCIPIILNHKTSEVKNNALQKLREHRHMHLNINNTGTIVLKSQHAK